MTLSDGPGLVRGEKFRATTALAQVSEVEDNVRIGGGFSPLPMLFVAVFAGLATAALFSGADAMMDALR